MCVGYTVAGLNKVFVCSPLMTMVYLQAASLEKQLTEMLLAHAKDSGGRAMIVVVRSDGGGHSGTTDTKADLRLCQ